MNKDLENLKWTTAKGPLKEKLQSEDIDKLNETIYNLRYAQALKTYGLKEKPTEEKSIKVIVKEAYYDSIRNLKEELEIRLQESIKTMSNERYGTGFVHAFEIVLEKLDSILSQENL